MKKAVKYKSVWYHDAYKALCNKITKILFTRNKIIILNQLRKIRETLNLCGNTNCWLNVPVKKHESTSVDFIKTCVMNKRYQNGLMNIFPTLVQFYKLKLQIQMVSL